MMVVKLNTITICVLVTCRHHGCSLMTSGCMVGESPAGSPNGFLSEEGEEREENGEAEEEGEKGEAALGAGVLGGDDDGEMVVESLLLLLLVLAAAAAATAAAAAACFGVGVS